MHIRVIAVGTRQPGWVDEACRRYAGRLPAAWRFELVEIDQGRQAGGTADAQGRRILERLRAGDRVVALDERGGSMTSEAFAGALQRWLAGGSDVAFVIGGADGLAAPVLERAESRLSVSPFTLAHGVARVVLLEQLYRAHTLLTGHPYHRA